MGPMQKKIKELLETENISQESKSFLQDLKSFAEENEPKMVNDAYYMGYTDKERGKSPKWNYYDNRFFSIAKILKR